MDDETLRVWAWRFSLGTAIIVGILSWITGVNFLHIMIRTLFSYLFMYGLSYGSLYGFKKTAPLQKDTEADALKGKDGNNLSGALLDVAVGQDDSEWDLTVDKEPKKDNSPGNDTPRAGQVNADLSKGMPDSEKQAEMVRRMGWGE